MCESPIAIPNLTRFPDLLKNWDKSLRYPWKDYTSSYILVPCGHCRQCIRSRQDSLVQRIQLESLKNHFFMATLTYTPESLPIEKVNGYNIRYADTRDLRNTLKMLRKDNAFGIPFRYLCVSEMGSLRGRPHFHVLFMFPKSYFPKDKEDYIPACDAFASKFSHYFTVLRYWRRNVGKRGHPIWIPLTRYVECYQNGKIRKNYDFHYVNPFLTKSGIEDCGYYVLKYMFKPSDRTTRLHQALSLNLSEDEFKKVWNKVRPRYFASLGFGFNATVDVSKKIFERDKDIEDKIIQDISFSRTCLDFPTYFNPLTGKGQLISPYYLSKSDLFTYDDRIHFWNRQHKNSVDPIPGDIKVTPKSNFYTKTDVQNNHYHYEKTVDHCDKIGFDSDLNLLD